MTRFLRNVKRYAVLLITCALFLVHSHSYSQRQITGRVTDGETKKGIKDALIFTDYSANGIATNALGFFQVMIDTAKYLTIKCSGYQPARIKVPDVNNFQIALTRVKSDYASTKIVDPAFIKRANEIIQKYSSSILHDFQGYPYPWAALGKEKENLKNNKVKKIKNSLFESEFDKNGELLFDRTYVTRQFAHQSRAAGTVDEYARKDNGEILELIYIDLAHPKVVHKRDFRSAGDTLYARWSANDSIMGLGLIYKNMFVDKNVRKDQLTLYIYERKKLPTGFSYSELAIENGGNQIREQNKFLFNNSGLFVEYSSGPQNEKYFFDSADLIKERQVFFNGKLEKKELYVRDHKGLITELVEQEAPFRKDKPKFEDRIKYEYEFYE
jgi:hypothetical protein